MENEEFTVGQKVFLYTHAGGMARRVIHKKYKNGNFILEGEGKEQFSSSGWSKGQWARARFVPVNEKTEAEFRFRRLSNLIYGQAGKLKEYKFSESDVDLMQEISDFLKENLPNDPK